jgi:thymidylate synthase
MDNGEDKEDRTGIGTKSIFHSTLKFNIENNTFPLLTTKKMFAKGIIEELLFFIRGDTNTKNLESKGVYIWKGNTSKEFLNSRKLNLPEGDMGKGYGFQWRKFGENEIFKGFDQIAYVIDKIKNDRNSRRIVISAWNPQQMHEMALEPCHILVQFYVTNSGYLSSQFYMRSVDSFLGLPFNIASYALLTMLIGNICNLPTKELIFIGGDTHIYNNHFEQVKTQIQRNPFDFPKIQVKKEINSLNDIECLSFDDFEIKNYNYHQSIKADMAI